MADAPGRLWVADITQHETLEGWLYLAAVIDAFARRVVGWSMSDRMTSALDKKRAERSCGWQGAVVAHNWTLSRWRGLIAVEPRKAAAYDGRSTPSMAQ